MAMNEVDRVAVPLLMVAVPSGLVPLTKVTVPVGLAPVTVAVKVSCWLGMALREETTSLMLDWMREGAAGAGLVWLSREVAPLLVKVR
jgi:hypothetical protein